MTTINTANAATLNAETVATALANVHTGMTIVPALKTLPTEQATLSQLATATGRVTSLASRFIMIVLLNHGKESRAYLDTLADDNAEVAGMKVSSLKTGVSNATKLVALTDWDTVWTRVIGYSVIDSDGNETVVPGQSIAAQAAALPKRSRKPKTDETSKDETSGAPEDSGTVTSESSVSGILAASANGLTVAANAVAGGYRLDAADRDNLSRIIESLNRIATADKARATKGKVKASK